MPPTVPTAGSAYRERPVPADARVCRPDDPNVWLPGVRTAESGRTFSGRLGTCVGGILSIALKGATGSGSRNRQLTGGDFEGLDFERQVWPEALATAPIGIVSGVNTHPRRSQHGVYSVLDVPMGPERRLVWADHRLWIGVEGAVERARTVARGISCGVGAWCVTITACHSAAANYAASTKARSRTWCPSVGSGRESRFPAIGSDGAAEVVI